MRRLAWTLVVAIPVLGALLAGPVGLARLLFALDQPALAAPLMPDAAWRGYVLAARGRWENAAAVLGEASDASAYNRGNALARSHHYRDAIEAYGDALDVDPEDQDARFNKEVVLKILAEGAVDAGPVGGTANASANKEHRGKASDLGNGEASSSGNGFIGSQEGSSTSGAQGSSKVASAGEGRKSSGDSGLGKATGSASQGSGVGRAGGDLADVTPMLASNSLRVARGHTDQGVVPSVEWLQTLPDDPGSYLKLRIRAEQARRAARATQPAGDDD